MNKKILLPKLRFDGASNDDTQIRVNFEEQQNNLKNDDRDVILNLSQQFYDEKNSCNKYKIFGKMRMIFRNLNIGTTGYDYLKDRLSYTYNHSNQWEGYLPYDEFAFLRQDVYREINTGITTSDLHLFTGFTLTTGGVSGHQQITTLEAPKHNWNMYLSYVYSGDTNFPMKYTLSGNSLPHLSFVSGDGIIFRVEENNSYIILTSPVKHGMNVGEYIIISGTPYFINSVGNEIFNSEFYTIYISKSQISSDVIFGTLLTGKRCTNIHDSGNTTSQYYVHQHKTLTSIDDCLISHLGFESPIFEEERKIIFETYSGINDVIVDRNRMESIFYDFKDPFILTGLTNNLGYTPNEIYLTTIFRNGDGFFLYPPKIGYSFNFHDSWIDLHFNGNTVNETSLSGTSFTRTDTTDTYTFTSGDTLPKNSTLYGSFIEYIPNEMKERVISQTFHKIIENPLIFDHKQTSGTTYSGATLDNPAGLYYQAHYEIKLRELSPYVETSNTNNILNLPDNVKYFPTDGLWKWRDVYDLGYIDDLGNGIDFSYMNDILYVHKDLNFYLRNEKSYTNKKDGVKSFKNMSSSSLINC